MERELVRLSKFISLVLRHHPERIGIELDKTGWVAVEELLSALAEHGRPTSRREIERINRESKKQRFEFSEDGRLIRATYGHSIDVCPNYDPVRPPDRLYHGTVRRCLPGIRHRGLSPQERQYVHLSTDRNTALQVGARHGRAILLQVRAREMHEAGHEFYHADEGVWLTEHVPPDYLILPGSDA